MIFLSLSKNHTPWEQLRISGRGRSVQHNMAQKHLLMLAQNYGTLFQMKIKLLNQIKLLNNNNNNNSNNNNNNNNNNNKRSNLNLFQVSLVKLIK